MNSGRRIAAAILTAALSIGALTIAVGPAEALSASSYTGPSTLTDTTWPP